MFTNFDLVATERERAALKLKSARWQGFFLGIPVGVLLAVVVVVLAHNLA